MGGFPLSLKEKPSITSKGIGYFLLCKTSLHHFLIKSVMPKWQIERDFRVITGNGKAASHQEC